MRRSALVAAILLSWAVTVPVAAQEKILGSGSTFIYPLMTKWIETYQTVASAHIDYRPIGSSGGLTELRSSLVDFAVSEAPLVHAQLFQDGLKQFPLAIGAIVPIVNMDGIAPGRLRLSGELLADIFLGKVKNWADPAIALGNPGIRLPDRSILVVHRSDGSGTTFNWTDYLSRTSLEWQRKVGSGTAVTWPAGVGAQGNRGVVETVGKVKGAIGYVDLAVALGQKLTYALVQNRAGNSVQPGFQSVQAAVKGAQWAKEQDFYVLLNDAPAPDAFPIVATSFALVRAYPADDLRGRDTLAFFRWVLESGQDFAHGLNYVPLPPELVKGVEAYWLSPD